MGRLFLWDFVHILVVFLSRFVFLGGFVLVPVVGLRIFIGSVPGGPRGGFIYDGGDDASKVSVGVA